MAENPPQGTGGQTPQHLDVTVVTGDRLLFQGVAVELSAPALNGTIAIRHNHAPLLAALRPGELGIVHEDHTDTWAVGGGFVEVLDNTVIVLADTGERAQEIDVHRAEEALERAQLLARRHEDRGELQAAHELAVSRSRARIAVARKVLQKRP